MLRLVTGGDHPAEPRPTRLAAAALVVAGVLAAVAGFVDAVGFNRLFGVFPANQSGNVAFLGMAIGGDGPAAGWRCALSIAGFAVGAAAGFFLGRRLGPRKGPALIVVELVLLLIVTVVAGNVDGRGLSGGFTGVVLVALGSFAMGIQTEAIRRVAGVAVATTYQSGAVARIGEATTGLFRRSTTPAGARVVPRGGAAPIPILAGVLVTYCAGAALGAASPGRWGRPLTLPCVALALLVVGWWFVPRWFSAIDEDADNPRH
jgi:uncharacterized membrane protein YoaK (UPF0700 family)